MPQVIQSILDPVAPGRSQAKPEELSGGPESIRIRGPFLFFQKSLGKRELDEHETRTRRERDENETSKTLGADGPQRGEQHELREGEEQ